MSPSDQPASAARDLAYIRDVMERTSKRVDPHAFHYVHWGAIVLLWYPLATWLTRTGHLDLLLPVSAVALGLGAALSIVREVRLGRRGERQEGPTPIARQVMLVTAGAITAGAVLSAIAPAFGFIAGPEVPTLWGLVYAAMAFGIGVVYDRAFLAAAVVIFVGAVVAIAWPAGNGYVLGPTMGLGMIVPGWRAERRVRRGASA